MRCRSDFSTFNRKHHCRNCGNTFCGECSSKLLAIPKLGLTEPVRVCDGCNSKLLNPSNVDISLPVPRNSDEDDDLAKAIAASLKISDGRSTKASVRFDSRVQYSEPPADKDDDEDLQRAIQESLKDAESHKDKQASSSRPKRAEVQPSHQIEEYRAEQHIFTPPVSETISPEEVKSITAFNDMIMNAERNAATHGIASINPQKLQLLFSQVSLLAPKLIKSLADAAASYKQLYDMNTELAHAVTEYDQLLQHRMAYSQQNATAAPPQNDYRPTGGYVGPGQSYLPKDGPGPSYLPRDGPSNVYNSMPTYSAPANHAQTAAYSATYQQPYDSHPNENIAYQQGNGQAPGYGGIAQQANMPYSSAVRPETVPQYHQPPAVQQPQPPVAPQDAPLIEF